MSRAWLRIIRWTAIGVAALICLVGLALLGGYAFVQSEAGRAWLVETLNQRLAGAGTAQVRIGRLEGDLSRRIELFDVSVADAEGVWLRLNFVGASWHPAALLGGKLSISKLDAEGLTVVRKPANSHGSADRAWPRLPLAVAVEHFALNDAVLAQALLGEKIAFRASGDTAAEAADRIHTHVNITRTDGVSGQAMLDVLLQPRSRFVRFQLAVNEADGGVIARALDLHGLPSLSIEADGEGPLDALRGTLRARARDLASVEGSFHVDAGRGPAFAFNGRADVAGLMGPPYDALARGDIAFEIKGAVSDNGVRFDLAKAENTHAEVRLSGELRGFAADLDVDAGRIDLAPFSAIAGIGLQGQAKLSARVRSEDLRHAATVTARGTLSDLLAPDNSLHPVLGPQLAVTGTLAVEDWRRLTLSALQVKGSALELTADAALDADTDRLEGDYQLQIPELAVLSAAAGTPLQGSLRASGKLAGSLEQPTLSAQMSSPRLSLDEIDVGAAEARVNIAQFARPLRGDFVFSASPEPVGATTMRGEFSSAAGDELRIEGLSVQARESRLAGSMVIDLTRATATGSLAGRALPLAPWSDVANRNLAGDADVVLDLSAQGAAQRVEIGVQARALDLGREAEQALHIDALDVSARLEDAFGRLHGGMRVVASDARAGRARLTSTALELKMDAPGRVRGHLHSRGELGEPFELEVVAGYEAREHGFVIGVSQADADVAGQKLTLSGETGIEHDADKTELARTTFSVAGGRLSAAGRVAGEALRGQLEIDGIELAAFDKMVPVAGLAGTLSGHARVTGTRQAPGGELELRVGNLRSAETGLASAPPVNGKLSGEWRDRRLLLQASFDAIADTSLVARASVPLTLDPVSLAPGMPANEPLDGRLSWSGELGPLWDLLSPYEDRFTGAADLQLSLAGSVAQPRLSGHFHVTGGHYENVLSGTTLTDVELRLVGSGDKLIVEKLTAGDGRRGTLVASGAVDFIPAQSYPTNLRLDFDDMLLIARDDLTLNASGHLRLEGTMSHALLSGQIVTGQSELSLAGTLPPEVVELDVREVNGDRPVRGARQEPGGAGAAPIVVLDLDISVPGRAFVRGLGLDSEWKGDVKISGNSRRPNLAGVLTPVRGQFSLMGKSFGLERGSIRFTGSDNVDPLLDLTAEHATSGLTAMVRVTGSASRPKIALTSRPPLPESEIASQVLFGTDSSNLTPGQSLQLASAIATFSGTGGAVGILDSTRRALGVDVINFAESEQNPDSTRVSVGKYVADGVYIQVERGTEESSRTSTTVEVEVLPDVRVEGGTTETGGNKVGVKWKWDY